MWSKLRLIGLMAGLSGCAVILDPIAQTPFEPTQRHDISTSNDIAIISGSKEGVVDRRICQIVQPSATMELTVDAGKVSLVVGCRNENVFEGASSLWFATIEFEAEAGHSYGIVDYRFGVSLIDISDDMRLVTRSLSFPDIDVAVRTTSKALVLYGWNADVWCSVEKATKVSGGQGGFQDHYGFSRFYLEPDQVNVSTRCIERTSGDRQGKSEIKRAYGAEIVIDAEAGHSYWLSMQSRDAKCIQLTDITTDTRRPLVCQPVERLDE